MNKPETMSNKIEVRYSNLFCSTNGLFVETIVYFNTVQ